MHRTDISKERSSKKSLKIRKNMHSAENLVLSIAVGRRQKIAIRDERFDFHSINPFYRLLKYTKVKSLAHFYKPFDHYKSKGYTHT